MVREIYRRMLHIISGAAIIAGALLIEEGPYKQILLGVLAALLLLEFIHSDLKIKIPIYSMLEREHEKKEIHGSMYYILGITIAFFAFSKPIALAATAMMAFGDGVAGFTRGKKATAAMFATSIITGYFFVPILTSFIMAVTATLVERYFKIVNDNLAIPILAGIIGALL